MFHLKRLTILLIAALFMNQCSQKSEDTVVSVGSLEITRAEIVELLKTKYPDKNTFVDIDIEEKKDLIEPLINKKLRINSAYDMGLDQDKELQSFVDGFKLRLVGGRYYELMIMDHFASEDDIETYLFRQGFELKASHILIGHQKANRSVDRTIEEAKTLAEEIIRKLTEGADFTEMVEKYSDDPSAKRNKGNLGYFTWGRMVQAFQEAIWPLEIGQISEPVETRYGIHIIRLDDKRKKEDYVTDRGHENIFRIKQVLTASYSDSSRNLWDQLMKDLETSYQYVLHEDIIDQVAAVLREKIKNEKITADSFSEDEKNLTMAEWDGEAITLGTMIKQFESQLAPALGRFRDQNKLLKEVQRNARNGLIMQDAEEKGITEDSFVQTELQKFIEKQLNDIVEQRHILDKMDATDEEVRAFYEKYPQKFKKGQEIEIWEIYTKEKKIAEEILEKAKNGADFEQLARKYSEDKRLRSKGGYMGYVGKNARGTVSIKAHEIGPGGKIAGPVNYKRGWSVIKTGGIHEETIKPLKDVFHQAKNILKYEKALKKKNLWERSLRTDYEIIYDEEKLRSI